MSMFIGLAAQAAAAQLPGFLAGCWIQQEAERWTEECWTAPRGGLMIGSGREGTGDSVRHWEWMRIERGSDGVLTFHASPKGAPATAFRAVEASDRRVTFVNRAHDYPQRVSYALTATGIEAEISLADGSKPTRWRYRRSGSPAPAK